MLTAAVAPVLSTCLFTLRANWQMVWQQHGKNKQGQSGTSRRLHHLWEQTTWLEQHELREGFSAIVLFIFYNLLVANNMLILTAFVYCEGFTFEQLIWTVLYVLIEASSPQRHTLALIWFSAAPFLLIFKSSTYQNQLSLSKAQCSWDCHSSQSISYPCQHPELILIELLL